MSSYKHMHDASYSQLCENTASSTKPDVHNVSPPEEDRATATSSTHENLAKFSRGNFYWKLKTFFIARGTLLPYLRTVLDLKSLNRDCRAGWRRGSSQSTLGFPAVTFLVTAK